MLLYLWIGWRQKPGADIHADAEVTVVIAARNEAEMIGQLLEDLCRQGDPDFRVIVVDDHSQDATSSIVDEYAGKLSIEVMKNRGQGKKMALTQSMQALGSGFAIVTDADCRVSENWIAAWKAAIQHYPSALLFGPVRYFNLPGLFQKGLTMEFALLTAVGGGSINNKMPIMANAANMAVDASAFQKVKGYHSDHTASGDDIFLAQKITSAGLDVAFIRDRKLIVDTAPPANWLSLWHQRRRWAGKWKKAGLFSSLLAVIVFLWNVLLMLSPLFLPAVWSLLFLSVVVEMIILLSVLHFYSLGTLIFLYPLFKIIYPIYTLFFGVSVNFGSYYWKGRKYSI